MSAPTPAIWPCPRRASPAPEQMREALDAHAVVREEWHKVVKRFDLQPGSATEELVSNVLLRLASTPQPVPPHPSPDMETVREALRQIARVPRLRPSTGHLSDCAWCNGSADIARKTLATLSQEQGAVDAEKAGPEPVAIKPLEWEGEGHWIKGDNEGWLEEANTPFGWGYCIEFGRHDEGDFVVDSTFGARMTGFDNPDDAKAAAQADYEQRIRSCLASPPPSGLDRETVERCAGDLSSRQQVALRYDERAVEELPGRDRDKIIELGLARRAHPGDGIGFGWRTWLTPLGFAVRDYLRRRALVDKKE